MIAQLDRGDRRVGEHGVDAAQFQIAEVVHILVVHAHFEAGLPSGQSVRQSGSQHADASAGEVRETPDTGILGPRDQLLSEREIGPAHGHLREVLGRALEGRDDDVEIAALAKTGDEIGPVVLDESGFAAESLTQGLGQLHLEAHESVGLVGRVEDVGGAPFGIIGPPEHPGKGRFRLCRHGAGTADEPSPGGPRQEHEDQ